MQKTHTIPSLQRDTNTGTAMRSSIWEVTHTELKHKGANLMCYRLNHHTVPNMLVPGMAICSQYNHTASTGEGREVLKRKFSSLKFFPMVYCKFHHTEFMVFLDVATTNKQSQSHQICLNSYCLTILVFSSLLGL